MSTVLMLHLLGSVVVFPHVRWYLPSRAVTSCTLDYLGSHKGGVGSNLIGAGNNSLLHVAACVWA
ncbi:hypothetical protein JHK82_051405 [Glycine max]|uniref:Secreted protein n=1 Tax=Glycine soja TaxID=3848 RepID=A0A0B2NVW0_GLYSO|nr:hypothetical protein JHK85_052104 [Glycine max]KAG5092627.1 hypothetical protein JHK82_051405 [Glycine max]KHM99372.1 hypothetical protein glysoja_028829 [Glycine soja]